MGDCQHILPDPRERCPHPALADSERCLWHSPAVPKHQAYVAEVFRRADAAAGGRFAGAHLAGLHLADSDLHGRDLRGADLRDAVLDGCDLTGCDLTGANLRRASLRHARLGGARLGGADLSGANLAGADLREVDFSAAIIAGTVLNAADLRGANLKGARITDFHWNRLTRFAGVRGLEASETGAGDDSTQVFPAPLALGDQDIDSGERLALDRDPGLERTRLFSLAVPARDSAPRSESTVAVAPAIAPPPPSTWRGWLVPCLAGAALTAAAWGATALAMHARTTPANPGPDQLAQLAQSELQHRADLDELGRLQRRLADQDAELARSGQQRAAASGDQERLRALLADQDAELARLRGADDRAALLALRVGELETLSRDLARQSARQDRVARILADGLEQHRGEAERLAQASAELRSRASEAERDHAEAVRLRQDLAAIRQERDTLQGLYQRAGDELRLAQRDIQRYLARVNASSLQGMLNDEDGGPLLAVKAGQPLALGGEFLVSLQVDRAGSASGQVQVRLVVQRPAAAANPDATVVLYDQAQRPLRRLSFSFPHVDAGAPFVSASATVSCDRFPAHARVLLVPGDATLAAR